ncbi:MAG: hypothetical protein GSR85_04035 [Desulfurococcales archaeon]|nr:hypothetical protein [Desulfurococcales archaeon]
MAKSVDEAKRRLNSIFSKFMRGEAKGLVLTLLSLIRVRRKGLEASPENIAREASEILERTSDRIDWGIERGKYTVELASSLLEELVAMGVLEELEGAEDLLRRRYRIRRYDEEDLEDEVYRQLGVMFAMKCC